MDNESLLREIDNLKAQLDGLRPLTPAQVKNLKNLFDIDFTFNSTAIEGNTFTLQETRVVLLDGITIGGKTTREHLEIVNHKEAIDYIEIICHKRPEDFSKSDVLNIHFLKQNLTDPLKLVDEMDEFYAWLSGPKTDHPVEIAAEAHMRFVSIHPFVDGNGRTARLLMNLILLHFGFPPAVIKVSSRSQYLDAIEEWQQKSNEAVFVNLAAKALHESLEIYLETIIKGVIWK